MDEAEIVDAARAWMRSAEEELVAAESSLREDSFVPRRVCSQAHAAADKALKGLLTARRTYFTLQHDLATLHRLLPEDSLVRREYADLTDLACWAEVGRFPFDWQEATVEDAQRTARQVRELYESALAELFEMGVGRGLG